MFTSLEARFDCLSVLSNGSGGGGDELNPGGVAERRDLLDPLDGVLYGVSVG